MIMGNSRKLARWAMAVALLAVASTSTAQHQRGIVGKAAPKWSVDKWVNLPEGKKKIDVEDYRGKVLYLFFFQSWCPGCHSSGFPTLQAVMSRFADNNDVAFVAIQTVFEGFSSNTFEHAKEAAKKYKLTIPIGQSGEDGVRSPVMGRYRSGGTPWVVIVDGDGTVHYNDFRVQIDQAEKLIRAALKIPPTKGK